MLELTDYQRQLLYSHAEKTYPDECCGLLLGYQLQQGQSLVKILYEVYPTENNWENQKQDFIPADASLTRSRHYSIAPEVLLATQKYARKAGLEVMGIYHSHPDHPAIPSECDRIWAWPFYSYMIISVGNGKAQDLQSWVLDDQHQFQSEGFVILNSDPVAVRQQQHPPEKILEEKTNLAQN